MREPTPQSTAGGETPPLARRQKRRTQSHRGPSNIPLHTANATSRRDRPVCGARSSFALARYRYMLARPVSETSFSGLRARRGADRQSAAGPAAGDGNGSAWVQETQVAGGLLAEDMMQSQGLALRDSLRDRTGEFRAAVDNLIRSRAPVASAVTTSSEYVCPRSSTRTPAVPRCCVHRPSLTAVLTAVDIAHAIGLWHARTHACTHLHELH